MNAQIAGVMRILIASALTGLVAKGILTADQSSAIVEGLIGVLGVAGLAAWSWISNSLTALITKIAKHEDVHQIITNQAIANAVPSPKVVPLS
jgi:hypothetical protein